MKEKAVRLMVKSEARINHLLMNTLVMVVGLNGKTKVERAMLQDW